MKTVELNIEGMHCEGCVNRVNNVVSKIKGIETFSVSLEDKKITLILKSDDVINNVKEKIENLGFKVM